MASRHTLNPPPRLRQASLASLILLIVVYHFIEDYISDKKRCYSQNMTAFGHCLSCNIPTLLVSLFCLPVPYPLSQCTVHSIRYIVWVYESIYGSSDECERLWIVWKMVRGKNKKVFAFLIHWTYTLLNYIPFKGPYVHTTYTKCTGWGGASEVLCHILFLLVWHPERLLLWVLVLLRCLVTVVVYYNHLSIT